MGRNRKFVLEDDLQQAVWRTILRGPRPPSAKWERTRSKSAAQPSTKDPMQAKTQGCPKPSRTSMPPEEAMAAARARATKLQLMLDIGRGGRNVSHNQSGFLEGACAGARASYFRADQEHTVVLGPQAEARRADTCRHREGPRSIGTNFGHAGGTGKELLAKEQAVPSPFSVHVPPVGPDVQAEFSRMQETISRPTSPSHCFGRR